MDSDNLDFDSVDTYLLRSPNDFVGGDFDDEHAEVAELGVSIPKDNMDVPSIIKEAVPVSADLIKELLEGAASEVGISVTETMVNTAIALSSTKEITKDSMAWFVMGITMANNNMVMDKLGSMLKDLQAEVRSIQSASSLIKVQTDDFAKKVKGNRLEITTELSKTKDAVLSALQSIHQAPAMSGGQIQLADVEPTIEPAELPTAPTVMSALAENAVLTQTVSTSPVEEAITKRKIKFLYAIGFVDSDIQELTPDMINIIVSDEMMVKSETGMTKEEAESALDLVTSIMIEADLINP
ncbi:TPA_asm: P [Phyllostachys alphacytorhabdovirus 1]|nr:TPA_asm: P [Phyllostachys alphacytorhabdovirus 1]